MSLKLYQLTDQMLQVLDQAVNHEGDISDVLDGIQESFELKCIAVAKYIKGLEAEASAINEAAKAMVARAKSKAKQAESLTDYLRYNIEKSGLADPIKCVEFEIKLQTNPPSLVIYDSSLIPDLYKIEEKVVTIDKATLKQHIKDGFEVQGAKLERSIKVVIK